MGLIAKAIEEKYQYDEARDSETMKRVEKAKRKSVKFIQSVLDIELNAEDLEWANPEANPAEFSFKFEYDSLLFVLDIEWSWIIDADNYYGHYDSSDPELYVKRMKKNWRGKPVSKWRRVTDLRQLGMILCEPNG